MARKRSPFSVISLKGTLAVILNKKSRETETSRWEELANSEEKEWGYLVLCEVLKLTSWPSVRTIRGSQNRGGGTEKN